MSVDFVFLDSGTGGIPYMNYLKEKCPKAECVYVADTKNFPYGEKSRSQIEECVALVCKKIIQKFNPFVIVIACNTMSVNALEKLRKEFTETAFVGTVPAIKPAALVSKKRRIGLIASNSTANHPYNLKLKEDFAGDCTLFTRGDSKLISFIEHESFTATEEECLKAVQPSVEFFKSLDCDAVILGCTHFLNIKDVFQKAFGKGVAVVDSKEGVVRHALEVWKSEEKKSEISAGRNSLESLLYVTGFTEKKDEKEYNVICKRFGLTFKGKID